MINIYIINLQRDKKTYNRTLDELKKTNYNPKNIFRYDAIDGNKVNRNIEKLHPICKNICTNKLIGIGLSHIKLCQELKNKDINYALILEDDIKINKIDLNLELTKIITHFNNIDPLWDIIILHLQGNCKYGQMTYNYMCGSTAAYLISKRGLQKQAELQLFYHIDWNRNSLPFRTYSGPNLFKTYDPSNEPFIYNKSITFWEGQRTLKIPYLNIDLSIYSTILLFILLVLILFHNIHFIINLLVIFIITFLYIFQYYSNNVVGSYLYSKKKSLSLIIISFIALIALTCLIFTLLAKNTSKYIYILYILFIFFSVMLSYNICYYYDHVIRKDNDKDKDR